MRTLALLLALIAAAALPAGALARERVAVLPAAGQPTEIALAGGRIAWAETVHPQQPRFRELPPVRVRIAGPGEPPRTLVTFPAVPSAQPSGYHYAEIEASATHVAVARVAIGATPVSRTNADTVVHVDELWAGPLDGPLTRVAACEPGGDDTALARNFDVSAGRLVRETCAGGRDLVVRDLGNGLERTIARGGVAGRHVSIAGRFLAWEERDEAGFDRTLVVHDLLRTGLEDRRIAQPRGDSVRVLGFYVQEDGTLLDPHFSRDFASPVPIVYPPEGDGRLLRPMTASRLARNQTLETNVYGRRADLTVNGIDGTLIPVARIDAYRLGQTDFDGEFVAWGEAGCDATTLYVQRAGGPLSVSRSTLEGRCARVVLAKAAELSDRNVMRLRLRCVEMRRCAGRVKVVRNDGTRLLSRTFDFGRATRGVLRARLAGPAPDAAHATAYDRDGFILARGQIALRPAKGPSTTKPRLP